MRRCHGRASTPDRRPRRDAGQSTAEMALILPVVVLFALLLVQVGLVVHQRILVTHTAREVARAAAVADGARLDVDEVGRRHNLDPSRLVMRVEPPDAAGFVKVTLRYRVATDVAVVGALLPDVHLDAEASMLAER